MSTPPKSNNQDKPIRRPGTRFLFEVPEGQPITLKYLTDAYRRAMAGRTVDRGAREQMWKDAKAWLAGKPLIFYEAAAVSQAAWDKALSQPLRAKMKRDATIAVLKANCGVK